VLLQEVFRAEETLALLEQHQCTTLFAWPHQVEALLALPQFRSARLALRKGVGANTKWAGRLYPPDHQAVATWGMTETGPMAAATRFDDPLPLRAGSHGRATPGLEIRIVDPQDGTQQPVDSEGEIVVRGRSLMRGYYGMSVAECFDRDGFFHTGDCGCLDASGHLHFLGRLKDVIKTAGVNVAAAEVEAVLLAHPAVKVAHVVPVPHATRGENVAAFIVCNQTPCSAADLRSHCESQLASYKIPRHFFFCREDELPVLGSGKVDRQVLRARAAELAAQPA
jgi:fatty-acyl-CoA synthase